jgi:hypothetical protein
MISSQEFQMEIIFYLEIIEIYILKQQWAFRNVSLSHFRLKELRLYKRLLKESILLGEEVK